MVQFRSGDKNKIFVSPVFYFGVLIFAYLLFITFASFYLTDFVSPRRAARAGAGELFFLADEFRLRWWNLRDIATNILLYMPLGFLVALYLASSNGAISSKVYPWLGFLLSVGVEVIQAFIGRFSDATDVLSNGGGYLLGFYIARTAVIRYSINPASLLGLATGSHADKLNTLVGLRFVYLAIVIVTALLPLDISVSMTQIYGKLQAGDGDLPRLIVDPFYHFRHAPDFQYLTLHLLAFLPLAFLSSIIQLRRVQTSLLIPALHCLLLGLTIESANLFVRSGRSDIIVPVMGFCAGLAVAWITASLMRQTRQYSGAKQSHELQYLLVSAALIYLLFLLSVSLSPYEFELSLRSIRSKLLNDSNFLPFRLHFSARSIASAIDIVRECILYAPFGALLALWLRNSVFKPGTLVILITAGSAGMGLAVWIEMLQLAVVGRYVDITDVLLATLGGLGGALLAPLFAVDGKKVV